MTAVNRPDAAEGAMPTSNARLVLALVLGVVAVSFAAILFRAAPDLHPLTAAGWRLVVAGLVLVPFMRGLPREALRPALLAGVIYALHFGTWVASLGLVSVVVSVTLVTTTPLMLALVGLVSGRDKPRPRALMGLGLGVVGVVMLAMSSEDAGGNSVAGVLLALAGAATFGLYLIVARGVRLPTLRASLGFAGVAGGFGGLLLLMTALLAGAPMLPTTMHEVWVIVGAALLPQLVGHTMLTWAVTKTTPTTVALATLGEPIGSALLAWALLSEALTALGAVACVITLAAVALALSDIRRDSATSTPSKG